MNNKKFAVLSLSGGMDSSTLLLHLLEKGYEVKAISFNYGQKHECELIRAKSLWKYLVEEGLVKPQNHIVIDLPLQDLLHSSLIKGGNDVPEGHYEDATMKDTVVPNRNKIFSSIIQATALSWSNLIGSDVDIAMGIHAGDHSIYPDCTSEFREADYFAFLTGNWEADRVKYYTPYITFYKEDILRDGKRVCSELGLHFDSVYSRTLTSYKPILIEGHWYSDYKSSSSIERIEAFLNINKEDPINYADENGPVPFSVAVDHYYETLNNAKNK